MAITPTPLPLAVVPSNRDSTTDKDAKIINGFVEKGQDGTIHVYKRPALALFGEDTFSGGVTLPSQGLYAWRGDRYAVFHSTLYRNGTAVGTLDPAFTGLYSFSSNLGATPHLFITSTSKGWYYDPVGGLHQITDPNFPTSLCPGSAFLDQASYVMNSHATIFEDNPNDLTTWDPLSTIIAQIEPDGGVYLTKQMSYIIALKEYTVETFYDAGNPAGSSLAPVPATKISMGCCHPGSVQNADGIIAWMAQFSAGGKGVAMMESLKSAMISTPEMERLLQPLDFDSPVHSWVAKYDGHRWYGLTLPSLNLTLVYDFTEQLWYQWTDQDGNYLPIVACAYDPDDAKMVLQLSTDTALRTFDLEFGADSSATHNDIHPIVLDVYTPNFDGGTRYLKYLPRMDVMGDQGGGTLQVRVSEDDYQSWSSFRSIDLSAKQPRLSGCGRFHRRAFHFRHEDPYPCRLISVELSLQLGGA